MHAEAAGRLRKSHQSPVTAAPPAQPPAGSSVRSARQPLLGFVVLRLSRPLPGVQLLSELVRSDLAGRPASQGCIGRMGLMPQRQGQKQGEQRSEQRRSCCAAAMQLALSQHGC